MRVNSKEPSNCSIIHSRSIILPVGAWLYLFAVVEILISRTAVSYYWQTKRIVLGFLQNGSRFANNLAYTPQMVFEVVLGGVVAAGISYELAFFCANALQYAPQILKRAFIDW